MDKIATPGDVAAACLGAVVGYLLGIYLLALQKIPQGVTPNDIATIGFISAFGIKQLIDALRPKGRTKRKRELRRKASALHFFFENTASSGSLPPHLTPLQNALTQNYQLWAGGVLTDDEFKEELETIEDACKEYARSLRPARQTQIGGQ